MPKKTGGKKSSASKKPAKSPPVNVRRNDKGQLLPGSVLNPDGPSRGYRQKGTLLKEAIEKVARAHGGVSIWEEIAERAYEDPRYAKMLVDASLPRPKPDTFVHVGVNQAQVAAAPADLDLAKLQPESRLLLRRLVQIEAAARLAQGGDGGATAPQGASTDGDGPDVDAAPQGATGGGNGATRASSGNGRRRPRAKAKKKSRNGKKPKR